MSGDFYKEWRAKAEIDYFPQLVTLWLSTNSWYRSHYSEITGRRDREFLNKLREDHSTRNKMFTRFSRLLQSEGTKEHADLLNIIEGLFFALNRAELLWDETDASSVISFDHCLTTPYPKEYGSLLVNMQSSGLRLNDNVKLSDDKSYIFNGLLEIVYQIRCHLVHGQLEPNKENHGVVKQCYFLLYAFMNF